MDGWDLGLHCYLLNEDLVDTSLLSYFTHLNLEKPIPFVVQQHMDFDEVLKFILFEGCVDNR